MGWARVTENGEAVAKTWLDKFADLANYAIIFCR
jgi:hypothetical protein